MIEQHDQPRNLTLNVPQSTSTPLQPDNALHLLIETSDDLERVKELIENGKIDPASKNSKGECAIVLACKHHRYDTLRYLFEKKGENPSYGEKNLLQIALLGALKKTNSDEQIKLSVKNTIEHLLQNRFNIPPNFHNKTLINFIFDFNSPRLFNVYLLSITFRSDRNEKITRCFDCLCLKEHPELLKVLLIFVKKQAKTPKNNEENRFVTIEELFSRYYIVPQSNSDKTVPLIEMTILSKRPKTLKILLAHGLLVTPKALNLSIHFENLECFRLLVDQGKPNINESLDKVTPLLLSCITAKKDFSLILIERGAHLNITCGRGKSLLHYSCSQPHMLEVTKILIKKGVNKNKRDPKGMTPIFSAFDTKNNTETIRYLIEDVSVDLNVVDSLNQNLLCYAVNKGCTNNLRLLIDLMKKEGVFQEQLEVRKQRPICRAAILDNLEAMDMLLEGSCSLELQRDAIVACITAKNVRILSYIIEEKKYSLDFFISLPQLKNISLQMSPLLLATDLCCTEMIEYLLGIYPEPLLFSDNHKLNLLQTAIDRKNRELFNLFVKKGFPLSVVVASSEGQEPVYFSALEYAIRNKAEEIITMLISMDNSFLVEHTFNPEGNNPIILAAKFGLKGALSGLLERARHTVNHANNKGKTALYSALKFGDKKNICLLLKNGADPFAGKKTAISYAIKIGQLEFIELLLKNQLHSLEIEKRRLVLKIAIKASQIHVLIWLLRADTAFFGPFFELLEENQIERLSACWQLYDSHKKFEKEVQSTFKELSSDQSFLHQQIFLILEAEDPKKALITSTFLLDKRTESFKKLGKVKGQVNPEIEQTQKIQISIQKLEQQRLQRIQEVCEMAWKQNLPYHQAQKNIEEVNKDFGHRYTQLFLTSQSPIQIPEESNRMQEVENENQRLRLQMERLQTEFMNFQLQQVRSSQISEIKIESSTIIFQAPKNNNLDILEKCIRDNVWILLNNHPSLLQEEIKRLHNLLRTIGDIHKSRKNLENCLKAFGFIEKKNSGSSHNTWSFNWKYPISVATHPGEENDPQEVKQAFLIFLEILKEMFPKSN